MPTFPNAAPDGAEWSADFEQWHPDYQDFAIATERMRHNQAVHQYGEFAGWFLMWDDDDLEAGRVTKCTECMSAGVGSKERYISDAYDQADRRDCPTCYGTTYTGGVKAFIIRPTLFAEFGEEEHSGKHGEEKTIAGSPLRVESTTDFYPRDGDYVVRATGVRYKITVPDTSTIHAGFSGIPPSWAWQIVSALQIPATADDVVYSMPPTNNALLPAIRIENPRGLEDFGDLESIHGPLHPWRD